MNGIISHGPLSRGSNIFNAANAKIAFLHFWLVFAIAGWTDRQNDRRHDSVASMRLNRASTRKAYGKR